MDKDESYKDGRLAIKISTREKDKLMTYIEKHHINLSALVRSLLSDYLDRQEGAND